MRFFRAAYAVAWKDVLLELRRKETFTAMFFFSLLVLLMFNFTLSLDRTQVLSLAPGLLWLAITFTGVLGLGKGFLAERENECMDGLILSPVPRGAIFLGKLAGNFLFIFAVEAVTLPLFVVLFNLDVWGRNGLLLFVVILGTAGLSLLGTLLSAMTVQVRAREVMFPLLILPLVIPVLIGAVQATAGVMRGDGWAEYAHWIRLLVAFDVVFSVASFWGFSFLLED